MAATRSASISCNRYSLAPPAIGIQAQFQQAAVRGEHGGRNVLQPVRVGRAGDVCGSGDQSTDADAYQRADQYPDPESMTNHRHLGFLVLGVPE